MDQEKIGKFILELRKEKNMTQRELANKLGVTDRAISKWENGRGMPDLSLIKSLCDELGITVNELLNGERIYENDVHFKMEETILNTVDYVDKKIKNNNKIFKIIIISILLFSICLIGMFAIDVNQMNQHKPVVFSTWGYKYTPAIDLYENEIYFAIKDHLVEKGDNESKRYDGEKTFVSMKVFLLEEKERDALYYVSAWVVDGKYYIDNNELKESSASSIPYKFKVEKKNDIFVVTDSKYPRDGSYYPEDMKTMFTRDVRKEMEKVHIDGTIDFLLKEVKEQAKLYFNII